MASGILLGASVVNGANAGLSEASQSIGQTLTSVPFITLMTMFIGFSFCMAALHLLLKHRGLSSGTGGWDGKIYASGMSLSDYQKVREKEGLAGDITKKRSKGRTYKKPYGFVPNGSRWE